MKWNTNQMFDCRRQKVSFLTRNGFNVAQVAAASRPRASALFALRRRRERRGYLRWLHKSLVSIRGCKNNKITLEKTSAAFQRRDGGGWGVEGSFKSIY